MTALRPRSEPATMKTNVLCSEIQINWGTVLTVAATAAPIPIDTNKAGSAQQINVLNEVKSVR